MRRRRSGGYLGGSSIIYANPYAAPVRPTIRNDRIPSAKLLLRSRESARQARDMIAAGVKPRIPRDLRPLVQRAGGIKNWIRRELGAEADKPRPLSGHPRDVEADKNGSKSPKRAAKKRRQPRKPLGRGEFKADAVVQWYSEEKGLGVVSLLDRPVEALLPAHVAARRPGGDKILAGQKITCWISKGGGGFQVVQIAIG